MAGTWTLLPLPDYKGSGAISRPHGPQSYAGQSTVSPRALNAQGYLRPSAGPPQVPGCQEVASRQWRPKATGGSTWQKAAGGRRKSKHWGGGSQCT